MRYSLLQIVKDVLSSIDSDEVEDIAENTEAIQVTEIIRSSYFALMSEKNWRHQKKGLFDVAPFGVSKPTHVRLPDNVKEVLYVNYDKRRNEEDPFAFAPVKYLHSDDFIRFTNGRRSTDEAVHLITDFSGIQFMIRDDSPPTHYTSFDDKYLVFDSFNKEMEDTVVGHKIQGEGYFLPVWLDDNDFIPDLPSEMFQMLINTAKRTASINLKQSDNPQFASAERRQRGAMSNKGWRVSDIEMYPNYGRRGK